MAVLMMKVGSVVGEWIRFLFVYYMRDGYFHLYVDLFQLCITLLLNGTNFIPVCFVSAYIKISREKIMLL